MRETALGQLGERIYWQGKAKQSTHGCPANEASGTSEAQAKDELILRALGDEGLSMEDPNVSAGLRKMVKQWAFNKSLTIAGGTSEVQLTSLLNGALGMPSGRVSRDPQRRASHAARDSRAIFYRKGADQ